uniref:Uncharacterized protein n=1 Tax=Setaria digitata TaxID=48799 RepID=A0A915PWR7_9BILA
MSKEVLETKEVPDGLNGSHIKGLVGRLKEVRRNFPASLSGF